METGFGILFFEAMGKTAIHGRQQWSKCSLRGRAERLEEFAFSQSLELALNSPPHACSEASDRASSSPASRGLPRTWVSS